MHTLLVDNIKCGGCANSISKKLLVLEGVSDVLVDVEKGEVCFATQDESQIDQVKQQLASMGYPEVGTTHGIASAGAKAKSFVSCAVGQLSEKS